MTSEKCRISLEAYDKGKVKELCVDFREKRRMVGCLAVRLRDKEGLEFGPSVSKAWSLVKGKCGK